MCSHPCTIGYKHLAAPPLNPLGFLYLFPSFEVRYLIQMMRCLPTRGKRNNIGLSCIDLWVNRIPNCTDGEILPETTTIIPSHNGSFQNVISQACIFCQICGLESDGYIIALHLLRSTINVLHKKVQASSPDRANSLLHSHSKIQSSLPAELSGSPPHLLQSRAHCSQRKAHHPTSKGDYHLSASVCHQADNLQQLH
ncbi:unnamed protein product [Arctogadus glacialis]